MGHGRPGTQLGHHRPVGQVESKAGELVESCRIICLVVILLVCLVYLWICGNINMFNYCKILPPNISKVSKDIRLNWKL